MQLLLHPPNSMTNSPHAIVSVRLRFPCLPNDEVKKINFSGLKYYDKLTYWLCSIKKYMSYNSRLSIKISLGPQLVKEMGKALFFGIFLLSCFLKHLVSLY